MLAAFARHRACFCFVLVVAALVAAARGNTSLQIVVGQETSRDPWWAAGSRPYERDSQRKLSAQSEVWDVSLTTQTGCPPEVSALRCYRFAMKNRVTQEVTTFRLGNETSQVDALTIVRPDRLAILGRTPELSIVTVLALPSGREVDRIICSGASLSPDRRYFAYLKFVPAYPGYEWSPSAEYLVYDLTASPEANRTPANPSRPTEPYDVGWPLYPEGAKNVSGDNMYEGHDVPVHWMSSEGFFWLNQSDIVAFVDRWEGTNSLVVADLSGGIERHKVSTYPLKTSGVVDLPACKDKVAASDLEAWSKDPGGLIHVSDIRISLDGPHILRLGLSPHPCIGATQLDVRIDGLPSRASR